MDKRAWSLRQGFSLVELLVGLVLLSVIALALASTLGTGLRIFERAERLGEHDEQIAARQQLRRFLVQARPPNVPYARPPTFVGDDQGFRFSTDATLLAFPEATDLSVEVRAEEGGLRLTVNLLDGRGAVFDTIETDLLVEAGDIYFDYLRRGGGAEDWDTTWTDPARVPALVRITAPESIPEWPEFIVAPRLGDAF